MSSVGSQRQPQEILVDLLIKQVTEGLTAVEQDELDAYDSALVSAKRRELDEMLAALSFGMAGNTDAPPTALRAAIEQQGLAHLAGAASTRILNGVAPAAPSTPSSLPVVRQRGGIAGWLAAAACLVFALIGWMRPGNPTGVTSPPAQIQQTVPPVALREPLAPPPKPRTAAEGRAALLARADTVKVTLAATKDPAGAGVTADVVWDPVMQTGFLRLVGLKANDPKVQQYQAWIFDGARDKRYPIDVAIFDVTSDSSEVIIPIQAAIPVKLAKVFAVTVENPGGVVVPDRAHVVVLGNVG